MCRSKSVIVRHTPLVMCRLDRVMGNNAWAEMFSNGRCQYLRFEGSDHRPLLSLFEVNKKKKRGLFRYKDSKIMKR